MHNDFNPTYVPIHDTYAVSHTHKNVVNSLSGMKFNRCIVCVHSTYFMGCWSIHLSKFNTQYLTVYCQEFPVHIKNLTRNCVSEGTHLGGDQSETFTSALPKNTQCVTFIMSQNSAKVCTREANLCPSLIQRKDGNDSEFYWSRTKTRIYLRNS